jgi:hypothetical protein
MDVWNVLGLQHKKKITNIMQDKKPVNEKGQRHGHWVWYWGSDCKKIMLKAYYVNDRPYGYMEFHPYVYDSNRIDYEYYAR